jgi:hypothetical protein
MRCRRLFVLPRSLIDFTIRDFGGPDIAELWRIDRRQPRHLSLEQAQREL